METFNFYYENPEQLRAELAARKIAGGPGLLVQVFSGIADERHTAQLIQTIRQLLPETAILGATTAGEILDDQVSDQRVVLSIARFRNARVRSALAPCDKRSMRQVGLEMAAALLPELHEKEQKVFVVFASGTDQTDLGTPDLLRGIYESRPDVPLAGGVAANAIGFDENLGRSADLGVTYVFTEQGLTARGAAGACIVGPGLQIHRDVNLGWKTIGKKMRITRVLAEGAGSRVFEIDGLPAAQVYRKYFGDQVAEGLPLTAINFPFIVRRDQLEIAATPIVVYEDKSILYNELLMEGESIQFGFGEPGLVLNESMRIARSIADYPHSIEGMFVYSCATRRRQLDHVAASELKPFHNIAPMSGFLTGGEFFRTESENRIIRQTMTILSLSEAPPAPDHVRPEIPEAAESKSIDSMLAIQTLVQRMTEELEEEQKRSENLLLNVLPGSIAARLKAGDTTIAERFEDASVLFADLVGFTELSSRHPPEEVVRLLSDIFSSFDLLVEKHGLEKIKTIGDAYMVAGGIPDPVADHAARCARMALDMLEEIERFRAGGRSFLNIRVGLHRGPIVAGVLGSKKFAYDLWGDTVNIASRMESSGQPGRVHVSAAVQRSLGPAFVFEERGEIQVKGKGLMHTFFLLGERSAAVV
ncbi:MAG: FIST C-terminal domain-containing protein [Leptospirales bacterium]|nr:FIST C-terminal domain-containing protein [Leptospirales bacterium]